MEKISLYTILTTKTNEDGTPLSGRYLNVDWLNGVLLNAMSLKEAERMRAFLGGRVVHFMDVPKVDVEDFARKYFGITPEKNYQEKLKEMASFDFDFMTITKGKRDKTSIEEAYKVFEQKHRV